LEFDMNESKAAPTISTHAARRMKQRAISLSALVLLLEFGARQHAPGGAFRVVMTDRALTKVDPRCLRESDKLRGIAAILSPDQQTVLTVEHRLAVAARPGCLSRSHMTFRRARRECR
jgi:hypothetical protein